MDTTLLVTHAALVPTALALVVAACVVVGYLLLRARRYGQRALWALVVLSVVPVVALTLVPAGGRSFVVCTIQFSVPTVGAVEALANIAMLIPLVFFATLATRRPLLVLAAGTVLSAAIETAQTAVPAIGRACDTNDWAMNTAGAVIAVLLAGATLRLARSKRPADHV
jgi:hypothetical protein